MKIRPLIFFAVAALLVSTHVQAAQAPKLDTLLAEYKKARGDVLAKLNDAYAAQADAMANQYLAAPDLEGADRARHFAKRLRDPDEKNNLAVIAGGDPGTDPLAVLEANYARSRGENLGNVYLFYTTTAQNLRIELLRTKDKAGADVLTAFLEKIKPTGPTAAKATPAKSKNLTSK